MHNNIILLCILLVVLRQPILDIHFDEKWFKGQVSRKNHKQCIELNIVEKSATEVKHKKSHSKGDGGGCDRLCF